MVLCLVVVAAMSVLASSLHDVHFQGDPSFSNILSLKAFEFPLQLVNEAADVPLWKTLLFWGAICIDIILFLYFLPAELRKRLFRQAIRFAVSILALFLAFKYHLIEFPGINLSSADQVNRADAQLDPSAGIPSFQPPEISSLAVYLVSLGVILAILLLLWFAYRWWDRRYRRNASTLDSIADVARASLDDLRAGRDWTDVIIRSYVRMSEVVDVRRGLRRAQAMTPREFARRLERAGLPSDAVGRLTLLFEAARYGANQSSRSEVNEAVACLGSILQACGEAV